MSYRRSVRPRWWRRLARWGLGAGVALSAWLAVPVDPALLLPPADHGTVLLDRAGGLLRSTRSLDGSRQQWIPLADIDPDLLAAFVAAEDRRFYGHRGVDPVALFRAAGQNLGAGRVVSGASTISMQVARLVRGNRRTWGGKLAQAAWAVRLDRQFGKQAILEQYLNRVPLGGNADGVDAAARLYFGKSAAGVSLAEAAMLAGLAHAPSRDNPLVSLERALVRRNRVLDRLEAAGFELAEALGSARLEPALGVGAPAQFLAPHFTSWVLGRSDSARVRGVVRTSLDQTLQRAVEAEVRHTVSEMRAAGAEHAAAVVLDNRSGEILSWVGSPDFFGPINGQVDMVVSRRQPGSALKPFLYGAAFDQGFTPASILHDVATVYPTATGPYAPRNYDRRYRGPVRIREALGSSLNVPAVALASEVGVARLLGVLQRAGFASLDRRADYYGLGLALGNGDVTLLELANGYRALANLGVWRPARWTATDEGGSPGEGVRVVSERAAAQVLDILADPVARIPGFGPVTPLEFPFRAAAKTGTSRHFTDNWAAATTERFTVAVWVGNFSGRPMEGVSGVSGAGPLLHRTVLAVASRYQPGRLVQPGDLGLTPVSICRLSGLVANGYCPALTEWFVPGTVPGPETWSGPDGVALPPAFSEWASRSGAGTAMAASGTVRSSNEPIPAGLKITSPRNGDRFRFVPGVDSAFATVGLRVAGAARRAPVRWFVDGRAQRVARWPLELGRHRIEVVQGRARDQVQVEVLP